MVKNTKSRVRFDRRQQHFGQHFDPPLVQPVALVHLVRLVELEQLVQLARLVELEQLVPRARLVELEQLVQLVELVLEGLLAVEEIVLPALELKP